MPTAPAHTPAPAPKLSIGHVHLRVSDLERAVAFYCDVIGLEVQQRYSTQAQAAFLSSDGYHHHIGLNTWDSKGAAPAPKGHPGLYHTAFLYPDRAALAVALRRALDHGVKLEGSADHGVSEAVYFSDPQLVNDRLDLDALLAEAT